MSAPVTGETPSPSYRFSLRTATLVLLPILSIAGAFASLVAAKRNGTFAIMKEKVAQGPASFPEIDGLLLRTYTGIGWLDSHLTKLVAFFAPALHPSHVDLVLFSVFGFGQLGAAWTLLMMESLRSGNRGKAVSLYALHPWWFGAWIRTFADN
jgi:hypothetical protein